MYLQRTPRLEKFILISCGLHLAALGIQALIPETKNSSVDKPPIKIALLEKKPVKERDERGTIVDAPIPKKIEKPRTSDLLSHANSRAHSNRAVKKSKVYKRSKTVVPKIASLPAPKSKPVSVKPPPVVSKPKPKPKPRIVKKPPPKPRPAKKPEMKQEDLFPIVEKGFLDPAAAEKTKIDEREPNEMEVETAASPPQPKPSDRALLDGFDAEKYASLDTQTPNEMEDDDQPISLDTAEAKYVSYFARIKRQIEEVWTYPLEAARRGVSGEMTLRFQISRDGNLLGVGIVNESGSEVLDYAAVKAVKGAAPFYPIPVTIERDKLSILANFIYSPSYRAR